jgi:hypothetical protein
MIKKLGLSIMALVGAMASTSSWAFVDVFGIISKGKNTTVLEQKQVDLNVAIFVAGDFVELDGAAEAEAIINSLNNSNFALHLPGEAESEEGKDIRTVEIGVDGGGALSGNRGVLAVNIDVGNMTNQANVVSVAVTASPSALTDAQAAIEQINVLNFAVNEGGIPTAAEPAVPDDMADGEDGTLTARVGVERRLAVQDSMNNNDGIVLLNVNAGDMNNQGNSVALAVGEGPSEDAAGEGGFVALSETDLGQVNTFNTVIEDQTISESRIVGSMNSGSGIVGINQSSGNLNNQASSVSIAATSSTVSVPQFSFTQ